MYFADCSHSCTCSRASTAKMSDEQKPMKIVKVEGKGSMRGRVKTCAHIFLRFLEGEAWGFFAMVAPLADRFLFC